MSTFSRTWRDEALDESARGFNYENHLEALMVAIRRAQPSWASMTLNADLSRVVEWVESHCDGARSLLPALHFNLNSARNCKEETPALLWLEATWEGQRFEITAPTPTYNSVVCLSESADVEPLKRFARALQAFCSRPKGRSLAYSNGTWSDAPHIDEGIGRVTWDDITLPAPILRDLRQAVEGFFTHREAVRSLGFPWKRGILMVGPPGTGKTMVCKAVATASPDLPFLYVSNFLGNNPIPAVFERARKLSPCILAFEDIDGLLDGANRTVFLNEMDGFASNEGLLIIASSNHPGKIDEALLRRPSRFDRVFHIGLPELEERRAFCEKLLTREALSQKLSPELDIAKLCDEVARQTEGFTPAYLKEAFLSAALSRAQEGAATLDEAFARAVIEQVSELKAHLKKTKNPDAMAEMRSSDDNIGFRR